eukprot:2951196-Ditylum_brightwellii.AAC.1
MESLRAETYGGIAVFTFLKHYRIYYDTSDPPNKQKYYCDNSTLIRRLKYDQTEPHYPSQNTQADYDAHMTLQKIMQELTGEMEIIHVKGHQDNKKKETPRLTWQAQLSIIVDSLATRAKYKLFYRRQKKCALLIPAEAYLLIEERPVTRAYQDEINSALSLPDLCDHMIQKYSWHTTTPDTINWELG